MHISAPLAPEDLEPHLEQPSVASPVFSPLCCPAGTAEGPAAFELSPRGDADVVRASKSSAAGNEVEIRAAKVPGIGVPPLSAELLQRVRRTLDGGGRFVPAEEGDGVWIITSASGKPVAVWKASDEERQDRSNTSAAIERGCPRGQRAEREYLAYLLDQALPVQLRAGVPPTLLVQVLRGGGLGGRRQQQTGSIQQFVESEGSSEDWGASHYGTTNVQRIAVFDLLTLNLDRHGGNMLVSKLDGRTLVPIDHGYALPQQLAGEPWLDWRLWPQAQGAVEPELCAAVLALSPELARPMVTALGLPPGVWKTARRQVTQLQAALQAGHSLRYVAESLMDAGTAVAAADDDMAGASGMEQLPSPRQQVVERFAVVVEKEEAEELQLPTDPQAAGLLTQPPACRAVTPLLPTLTTSAQAMTATVGGMPPGLTAATQLRVGA